MCGICGAVNLERGIRDAAAIDRMTDSLTHRGPDDRGTFVDESVMLGHRRLSILDLSDAGHQPMLSPDENVVVVYNGEVYNFPELREELLSLGHSFKSTSDTEVVLHAYLQWGTDSFLRLNGMFALAIWDVREQRLIVARDRFGIKPLHYTIQDGTLVFGSEIKAILEYGVPRSVNWRFLHEYIYYGNSLWEQSAFDGIKKLRPGYFLVASRGGVDEHEYWCCEDVPETLGTEEQLTAGVLDLLDKSVARHLISDVPVAVFLSGGIDSSAVAVLASRHSDNRLKTFSVGFDFSQNHDERPQAKRLADQLGTEHHELFIRPDGLPEVIESLIRFHDEPFADAANIPLLLMCRQLRDYDVKVALQGDGGDEIFAGYRRYNVMHWEWLWRLASRPGIAGLSLMPDSPRKFRLLRFMRAMAPADPITRLGLMMTLEDRQSRPEQVLSADVRAEFNGTSPLRAYYEIGERLRRFDPVQRALLMDLKLLLPDDFLPKVDRSTMSQSIESRVPFLDHELAEFVIGIPSRTKARRGQKKFLLRKALRGTVPDYILDAPKRGFAVPYQNWLRTGLSDYMNSVLLDHSTESSGLFDPAAIQRCIRMHLDGVRDYGFLLYKCLMLALWHKTYIDTASTLEGTSCAENE